MSIARFSWRQLWKGAVIWSAVSGVVVLTGVATFESAYTTAASRRAFAVSIGRLPAFQALYGRAAGVDTAGGFIAWRYGDVLTVVIGLWALLAVTRMFRGDEDTFRADVLLAGPESPRRLMVSEFAMLLSGCALIMVIVALSSIASGLAVGGSLLFGFMVAGGGVAFGAIAALTSQLFDTRRRAAGWAGAALGVSYLVRALADGSSGLRWLGWLTPLGWTERIEPFTGANGGPIVLLLGVAAIVFGFALYLRERRDTSRGLLGSRAGRAGARSIGSALALDWYLSTGALVAWATGIFVGLFVLGYLTHDMGRFAAENPTIDDMITRIYGFSISSAVGFLSLAFSVVALVLAVYAGTHMMSAREEETSGRVDALVVVGTSRARWLVSRVGVALGAMLALALVAAVGAWAGANVSGASVSLRDVVAASYNVIPTALFFGGLSVLAFGAVPRLTATVAFGAVAVAFLVQIVGGIASAPSWVSKLSPFSHIAPVPAASVDVTATIVMLAVAVVAAALGVFAFAHRDIA